MWRTVFVSLASVPIVWGASIVEVPMDALRAIDLPVSREVTTITLPGAITTVVGADMLIDDGKSTADVDEGVSLRFHVTHPEGSNFVLVRSLVPNASGRLTLIFEGAAYVVQLRTAEDDSVASAIFKRQDAPSAVKLTHLPEPVKFTPKTGLSLLDRARAYPVLVKSLPKAVEGVTLSAQNRKIELPDLEVTVQEVYRFSKEDALVFLLSVRNKSDHELDLAPSTFAARVGNEKFEQSIANGPRVLAPGETAEAEFAVVGMPDGTRNDLSADNAFTILVSSARRDVANSKQTEGAPTS
jgi:hypothetical protein